MISFNLLSSFSHLPNFSSCKLKRGPCEEALFKVAGREKATVLKHASAILWAWEEKKKECFSYVFILDKLNPETARACLEKCSYPMKVSSEVL